MKAVANIGSISPRLAVVSDGEQPGVDVARKRRNGVGSDVSDDRAKADLLPRDGPLGTSRHRIDGLALNQPTPRNTLAQIPATEDQLCHLGGVGE